MAKRTNKKVEKILVLIASICIKFYMKAISPLIGSRCRFYPSCSHYFIESLQVKGFVKGFGAGVMRILRCNPFCPGGYDPVNTRKK